jgi:hypothetical protein
VSEYDDGAVLAQRLADGLERANAAADGEKHHHRVERGALAAEVLLEGRTELDLLVEAAFLLLALASRMERRVVG